MKSLGKWMADDTNIERVFWIGLATLAVATYTLVVFHLGGWFVLDKARAEAAKIITLQRAAPQIAPIQLIGCSKQDLIEHYRTCKARDRSARVGAP